MVALKSPLVGLELSPEAAAYVGVLEKQVLGQHIMELKFRALMEIWTGQEWDDMKTDFEQGEIEKIAIQGVQNKLGMKYEEARKFVQGRMAASRAATDLSQTS